MPCFCFATDFKMLSYYLLLEIVKYFGGEEFKHGNLQAVTYLLDGRDGCAFISAAYNIVKSRLSNAGNNRQLVERYISLKA